MKTLTAIIFAAAFLTNLPANAGSLNDDTIFAIFDQANMADIATGRLGWKKGQSDDVRMLAKMVIVDHSNVQQMGRDVATKIGVFGTPPSGDQSWASQAEALQKLDKLTGTEFDKAYLEYEIEFHTAAINAIRTVLLPNVTNSDLKGLMEAVLPGFEHHLTETKLAADKMGVKY